MIINRSFKTDYSMGMYCMCITVMYMLTVIGIINNTYFWGLRAMYIHTRKNSQWHTLWLSGRTAQHPGDSPHSGSAGPTAGSPPYQPQVPPARHRCPTGFGTGNINGNRNVLHSICINTGL